MPIKSFSDLPSRKRPGSKQTFLAKQLKTIDIKPRRIKNTKRQRIDRIIRDDVSLVPSAVKSYRRQVKENFGVLFYDENGNVLGRTHFASAKTVIPEALSIKFLAKYKLNNQIIEAQAILAPKTRVRKASKKTAPKKTSKKTAPKKASKKTAPKKASKKTAPKKASKKTAPKKASKKIAPKKASKKTAPKKATIKKRTNTRG